MTEELLNALAQVSELQVTGRTSSFALKGKNADLREIGDALGVAHVIEGSIRAEGDRARITAQLIKTSDGYHLWSQTYDEDISDLFVVQEKIANAIAIALAEILEFAAPKPLAINLTRSREAYEAFAKGRELLHTMVGKKTLPNAVKDLEKAVHLDPDFHEAWCSLALAHLNLPEYAPAHDVQSHYTAAQQAIERAKELNSDSASLLRTEALFCATKRDFSRAADLYHAAYARDPDSPDRAFGWGYALSCIGLKKEALPFLHAAERNDPLAPLVNYNLAVAYAALGPDEKALYYADRTAELGMGEIYMVAAYLLARQGREREGYRKVLSGLDRASPWVKERFRAPFSKQIYWAAYIKRNPLARWIVGRITLARLQKRNSPISMYDGLAIASFCEPEDYFLYVGTCSAAWGLPVLGVPMTSITPGSKEIRQHPDFPQFAEDMGLVKIWQKYGWPPMIEPNSGTDGSDLQFTVTR